MKKTWFKLSAIIISLVLVTMVGLTGCTPDYASQIKTLDSSITTLKTDLETFRADISKLPTTSTVTTTVSSSLVSLNSKVTAVEASLNEIKTQITTIGNSASSASNTANSMQAKITDLTNQMNDIKKSVVDLQNLEVADKAEVAALSTRVAALTPATSATTPATGVVVSLQSFAGYAAVVDFPAIAAPATPPTSNVEGTPQTIVVKVDNRTGKTINSLQLGIFLQRVDVTTGVPAAYPVGVTLRPVVGGYSFNWAPQSIGDPTVMAFLGNQTTTGFMGQFNAFSQGAGVATYTIAISETIATVQAALAIPEIKVQPYIQLIGYTTQ